MKRPGEFSIQQFTRTAILQSALLILLLVFLGFGVRERVSAVYIEGLQQQLEASLEVIVKQFPREIDREWCRRTADQTQIRLSVVDAHDGMLLCDNVYQIGSLPPILDRAEIVEAMQSPSHRGRSVRRSIFIKNLERVYYAIYLPEQKVILRGGLPLSQMGEALGAFDRLFVTAILLASIVLAGILLWTSRRFAYAEARRALEESRLRMQQDFVANVSHEFRTPLTSIRGFASTLRDDARAGRPAEAEFVDIILKDSDRLLGMVNDLLDLSALEAGSLRLEREDTDVRELTDEVIRRLEMAYASKNSSVAATYAIDTAYADPERLIQILMNLIGNSLNHCPTGSKVEVRWEDAAPGARLVVQDNGPGIAPESQSRIFDRFARGEGEKGTGTGLGLPIVRELVKAHQGEIRLESEPGRGTRFVLWFPQENA